MINNPNVYVRNFNELPITPQIDKIGKVHTGQISAKEVLSYTGIKQAYMIIRADVTTPGTGYLETYQTLYADKTPVLKDLMTKREVDRVTLNSAGTYLLYADLFSVEAFKLEIGGGNIPTVADIYVAFANDLPVVGEVDAAGGLIYVSGDMNHGIHATFAGGSFVENTFPDFVIDRSKRWLVVDVLGKNGNANSKALFLSVRRKGDNAVIYPMAYYGNLQPTVVVGANPSLRVPNNGVARFIYDLSSVTEEILDGIYFSANTNLSSDTGCVLGLSYVAQTNDISEYIINDVVYANGGKFKFVGHRTGVAYWGKYYVNHTANSGLLDVGDGEHNVQVNLTTLLGITLNSTPNTHLIPFDPSKRDNNNASVGLVLQDKTSGAYYFCDLTNGIDAVQTAENWQVVKFWEKLSTKRRIPTKTSGASSPFRYDTTLPDAFYGKEERSGNLIQYQGTPSLAPLGAPAYGKKIVAIAAYDVTGERPVLWATTDGGKNWVGVIDFGTLWSKIANASRDTLIPRINTSGFAAYSSGLTLKKLTPTYPSAQDKEPAHILSLSTIAFSAISSANGCVVTAANHELDNGDLVAFTGAPGNDWAQLANSGISEDNLGDNIYFVERIDANSFYLRYYNGSYDTILPARHIHSVNEVEDGFLVATGEHYPESWIMLYQQRSKDKGAVIDVMAASYPVYRLNSSKDSVMRVCGILMDKKVQPDIIYFSDDSHIYEPGYLGVHLQIDGRSEGEMPTVSSNGVWRGKLADIDDRTTFERICDIPEPVIWIYRQGNTIIGYGMLGGMIVSYDAGDTWDYIARPGVPTNPFNGIKDGEICFGNGWVLRKN